MNNLIEHASHSHEHSRSSDTRAVVVIVILLNMIQATTPRDPEVMSGITSGKKISQYAS